MTDTSHLRALGAKTEYKFDGPHSNLLERFKSPLRQESNTFEGHVHIEAPEFTSLCPLTGQPDFATIVIHYTPQLWCVESKSLKLYLGSFRNAGEFHESCVQRILDDLVGLLEPIEMTVTGKFTPRGGIPFWPTAHYCQ